MRSRRLGTLVALASVVGLPTVACGSDGSSNPSGSAGGNGSGASGGASGSAGASGNGGASGSWGSSGSSGSSGSAGSSGSSGTSGSGGSAGSAGSAGESCEPFGRHGTPATTFTLPAESGKAIAYADVQARFPDVDWSTLDRLYVPAGQYKSIQLGNLPARDASRPLVITNRGGQVKVGPNDPGANYLWSMSGGSHWVLTGRYDADSATGDAAFPGHRCGAYAGARDHYGFVSDDAFATGQYLHMGVAVTDATDFELEFLEIKRSGFAGIRLLNQREAGDAPAPMANVRVHDNYVHDTAAEGIYFGWTGAPPSNLLPGLLVYNNRFVRTGNEALQIQDIGENSEIRNNVVAFAALHYRDNGLGKYQDNNSQIATRSGRIAIHHNVFVGGAGTLLSFWSQPQSGDGPRQVELHHNYVAETRNLGVYFGGTADAASSFAFDSNFFRDLEFGYGEVDPAATAPSSVIRIGVSGATSVGVTGNRWEGALELVSGGQPTVSGNSQGGVGPIEFVNSGYPAGVPVRRLEIWTAATTLAPGSPPRVYAQGELVMYDAELYECLSTCGGLIPPEHPEAWEKHAPPADDLRVVPGSAYADLGVH